MKTFRLRINDVLYDVTVEKPYGKEMNTDEGYANLFFVLYSCFVFFFRNFGKQSEDNVIFVDLERTISDLGHLVQIGIGSRMRSSSS